MAFLPDRGLTEAFARPSGELRTRPITEEPLDEFRRDPSVMCDRRFLVLERAASGDEPTAPPGKDVFYEVISVLSNRQAKKVNVLFEGCRVPDQIPLANILELVAESKLVVE
jgi:hypothetical protein